MGEVITLNQEEIRHPSFGAVKRVCWAGKDPERCCGTYLESYTRPWFDRIFKRSEITMRCPKCGDVTVIQPVRDDFRVSRLQEAWGARVSLFNGRFYDAKGKVTGNWSPIPRVGDIVIGKLKSGHVSVSVYTAIKHWQGVSDGFEGEIWFLGAALDT